MDFDWTTFALEIVNFLVLTWILQRLLYRPVMGAIARRRAAVEQVMADARAQFLAAAQLKQDHERRADEWRMERERAKAELSSEIEAERARRLAELDRELAEAREKARSVERQRLRELERTAQRAARERAAAFCASLLTRLANPGLDAAICTAVLEDLGRLDPLEGARLAAPATGGGVVIEVSSARPLSEPQRRALVDGLAKVLGGRPQSVEFHEDPTLIAGLAVGLGAWVLRANLRDELQFFAERAGDAA